MGQRHSRVTKFTSPDMFEYVWAELQLCDFCGLEIADAACMDATYCQ